MASDTPADVVCQDCGGPVAIQVAWTDAGAVDSLRFECQDCGQAGQTRPLVMVNDNRE